MEDGSFVVVTNDIVENEWCLTCEQNENYLNGLSECIVCK